MKSGICTTLPVHLEKAKVLASSCSFVPQETHGTMTLVNNGFDKAVTINTAGFRYIHSIPFSDVGEHIWN